MAKAVRATEQDESREAQPSLPIDTPTRQRSRIGRKNVSGRIDQPIARAFAVLAATQDRTQENLLAEAVEDLLRKYKQEPIATR